MVGSENCGVCATAILLVVARNVLIRCHRRSAGSLHHCHMPIARTIGSGVTRDGDDDCGDVAAAASHFDQEITLLAPELVDIAMMLQTG